MTNTAPAIVPENVNVNAHVRSIIRRATQALITVLLLARCADAPAVTTTAFTDDTTRLRAMLAAEDARPASAEALSPLLDGLTAPQAELRAWAVRGLGRMERDSLLPHILPALRDSSAAVRSAAADAVAQAVQRGDPQYAHAALLQRLGEETDPDVRGALAEALGRLRPESGAQAGATAERLIALGRESSEGPAAHSATLLGVARGLFFLARRPEARSALPPDLAPLLERLTAYGRDSDAGAAEPDSATLTARRIRRLALATSAPAGAATETTLAAALDDPDPWVRREAALAAGALTDPGQRRRLGERALADAAGVVRYEGLRVLGRHPDAADACTLIGPVAADADGHVALQAIDLLGTRCAASPGVSVLLDSLAGTLPTDTSPDRPGWHRSAHALVALVAADAERARAHLPAFVASANPFVRAYAATAAAGLREQTTLRALAGDADANVRRAAVQGLAATTGHGADSVYLAQLHQDDSQLLQAAAAALEGTTSADATTALLVALDRISTQSRETSRDARAALIERIGELGGPATVPRLAPYVRDFDPAIAARAAELVARWTGEPVLPAPQPLAPQPIPTPAQLDTLGRTTLVLEMEDGGTIELRPLPHIAPTNAARFLRLARAGYYDGLTFHRVAPNFVLQGGSPGANEYAGDGPYTRDEVGAANWRGTVGLSTRGRDTGDAQLYINLVDNVRLDHDYTVWAEVVRGMDVADRVLEGAIIRRAVLR